MREQKEFLYCLYTAEPSQQMMAHWLNYYGKAMFTHRFGNETKFSLLLGKILTDTYYL